jgi:heme-degrading monooxygenase HmoA
MFVLHVGIKMKSGQAAAAEQVFGGPFRAAISAQPGFQAVSLLRPDDGGDHILSIAFENQALQQKWVATDLHNQVWSQMESHFDGYTLRTFTAV